MCLCAHLWSWRTRWCWGWSCWKRWWTCPSSCWPGQTTKQHNLHFKLSVHTRQIRQTYTLNLSCLVYSPRAESPSAEQIHQFCLKGKRLSGKIPPFRSESFRRRRGKSLLRYNRLQRCSFILSVNVLFSLEVIYRAVGSECQLIFETIGGRRHETLAVSKQTISNANRN